MHPRVREGKRVKAGQGGREGGREREETRGREREGESDLHMET